MLAAQVVAFLAAGAALLAQPAPRGHLPPLREDPDLQAALTTASSSGQPHRVALADQILAVIDALTVEDPQAFKAGALGVLRHAADSDPKLGEMYLQLVQAPVVHQIVATREVASQIAVDGRPGDWPEEVVMSLQRSGGRPGTPSPIRKFAALRAPEHLVALFETAQERDAGDPDTPLACLEILKLSSRFGAMDYRLQIAGDRVKVFRSNGEELTEDSKAEPLITASGHVLEVAVPLSRIEPDLRSVVVRGMLMNPQSGEAYGFTPYAACPSGPVSAPLEMLIDFAARIELPRGNTLPLAVALQEGLLRQACHPDLAGRVPRDAATWLAWIVELDARLDLSDVVAPREQPLAAQLALACRYDGAGPIETAEAYEAHVLLPETVAGMRRFAHERGWWGPGRTQEPAALHTALNTWMSGFKTFDWPDQAARDSGAAFEDPRADAYVVRGEKRYLSYRDLGINRQWQMIETGSDLRGSPRQRSALLRAMGQALGQPTVWMAHDSGAAPQAYALTYDAQRRKWYPIGMAEPPPADAAKIRLAWGRPWTRPERFGLLMQDEDQAEGPAALLLLDATPGELTRVQLEALLAKGLPDEQFARSFLRTRK
jgi:hypothetical protein